MKTVLGLLLACSVGLLALVGCGGVGESKAPEGAGHKTAENPQAMLDAAKVPDPDATGKTPAAKP